MFATWVRALLLKFFRADGKPSPLIVSKVESPVTDLFTKDAILCGDVVDHDLLMLIEPPARQPRKNENGLSNAGMGRCYRLAWSRLCRRFQRLRVFAPYGIAYLSVDPRNDVLRSDPRFKNLVVNWRSRFRSQQIHCTRAVWEENITVAPS
jgi:hypothetical protein